MVPFELWTYADCNCQITYDFDPMAPNFLPVLVIHISPSIPHDFPILSLCRLLTGAILAHELMHGWLRLKGIKTTLHNHLLYPPLERVHCAPCLMIIGYRVSEPQSWGWGRDLSGALIPVARSWSEHAFHLHSRLIFFVVIFINFKEGRKVQCGEEARGVLHASDRSWRVPCIRWRLSGS